MLNQKFWYSAHVNSRVIADFFNKINFEAEKGVKFTGRSKYYVDEVNRKQVIIYGFQ